VLLVHGGDDQIVLYVDSAPGRSAVGRCCRKSLLGGNKQDFQKLMMRFVCSDVRDHIASQKNDHGPSYRHSRASQRPSSSKIAICEIFGVVRFSTFSTASTHLGHAGIARINYSSAEHIARSEGALWYRWVLTRRSALQKPAGNGGHRDENYDLPNINKYSSVPIAAARSFGAADHRRTWFAERRSSAA
jgi:hypothetical protein